MRVAFHEGGLLCGWSFMRVAYCEGIFHERGLLCG